MWCMSVVYPVYPVSIVPEMQESKGRLNENSYELPREETNASRWKKLLLAGLPEESIGLMK